MAYHDELLQNAHDMVHASRAGYTQAELRRSVSSAYYALFHLLIYEACLNWSNEISRPTLSRMFEHSLMKRVSRKVTDVTRMPYIGENPAVVVKLRFFAALFIRLQEQRHEADYNIQDEWTLTQSILETSDATRAFAIWREIRSEKIAQEYLVLLLIRSRD